MMDEIQPKKGKNISLMERTYSRKTMHQSTSSKEEKGNTSIHHSFRNFMNKCLIDNIRN